MSNGILCFETGCFNASGNGGIGCDRDPISFRYNGENEMSRCESVDRLFGTLMVIVRNGFNGTNLEVVVLECL